MVKHYCDVCGVEVDRELGVVGEQEITIESNDKKISIQMSVACYHFTTPNSDEPAAICPACLASRMNQLAEKARLAASKIPR